MVRKIYLAKIYFTDLQKVKIRPILVIKNLDKEDVICLSLSSQIKYNRIIIKNIDLIDGLLKKESIVVIPKNFTLNKSLLFKYLGEISENKFQEIYNNFCKSLECKDNL